MPLLIAKESPAFGRRHAFLHKHGRSGEFGWPMVRLFVASPMLMSAAVALGAPPRAVDYTIQLDVIREGYDGVHCWVHPRAGIMPNSNDGAPSIVLTLQQLWLKGSDVFGPLHEMRTDDLGRTWSGPREHKVSLGQGAEPNDVTVDACDFWPKWHAATRTLLGIGHTVRYRDNESLCARPGQLYSCAFAIWRASSAADVCARAMSDRMKNR